MKWREVFGFLCDKRISIRLNVIFYMVVVRLTIVYRLWSVERLTGA